MISGVSPATFNDSIAENLTITATYNGYQNNPPRKSSAILTVDPAGFNHDGVVNGEDFFYFVDAYVAYWATGVLNPACDLNHDGVLNGADFFLFVDDHVAYWQSVAGQNQ